MFNVHKSAFQSLRVNLLGGLVPPNTLLFLRLKPYLLFDYFFYYNFV